MFLADATSAPVDHSIQLKVTLFAALGFVAMVFITTWFLNLSRRRDWSPPTLVQTVIGFITDFLDTLGVGSFAVTTSIYRSRQTVPDELIPGTMNVGHALPTIVQAFIYIAIIKVEMQTLILTILASVLGAWIGAGFVTRWNKQKIQFGMGLALLAAAGLILARLTGLLPKGGDSIGLDGGYLISALVGNFVFGALMMIGVGAYAPIMVMVSLLGMNPDTAFPIMMGSCAFLMPIAGIRIINADKYDKNAALGLTLGGIPGVLIAAFVVWKLPLDAVRWLVVIVVIYTAISMLIAATNRQEVAHNDSVESVNPN
jgi:uncharacterized membrane protein YfcA